METKCRAPHAIDATCFPHLTHWLISTQVRRQDQETYISSRKAVQSNLQTGDVAIFDSRVLHCGLGNTSAKRRILFYCTVSAQHAWPLPDGLHGSNSVLPADRSRWRVRDFLAE